MPPVRGLIARLNANGRYKFKVPEIVVDHLIIGGGVVGLAIAQCLSARFPKKSTFLVERHPRPGEETSSRNSEVIHAGLYYPPDSLKTKLCLLGRQMLYERCNTHNIAHRKTGKLIIATEQQRSYIENLHAKAQRCQWPMNPIHRSYSGLTLPTELLSKQQIHEMEPDLSDDIVAGLWSPETGIIDSHALMESLEKDVLDSAGGELAYSTTVVRVDPYQPSKNSEIGLSDDGWVVQTITGNAEEGNAILAKSVINSSGLSGPFILNSLLPRDSQIPMYYARGSYASYHGPGVSHVSRLIYPCPETGPNAHAFESLGTHLTMDLQGKIRFGPDIEWISPPSEAERLPEEGIDFWTKHLVPNESRLEEMYRAVRTYLPDVTFDGLQPDYVGIRPKLIPPGGGFQDFVVRTDYPHSVGKPRKQAPMITLLGIESPGLTSSLAISQLVTEILQNHDVGFN